MPKTPVHGTSWYGHHFYNKWIAELRGPRDLQRLMVLRDGKLQSALDPSQGYPSPEKQEELFQASKDQQLFYYPLGKTYPMMYIPKRGTWISMDPNEISALRNSRPPEPVLRNGPGSETHNRSQTAYYNIRMENWSGRMEFIDSLPGSIFPVLDAQAQALRADPDLNLERDARESAFRSENIAQIQELQLTQIQDARIDSLFAPRPAPPSYMTMPDDLTADVTTASFFDEEIQNFRAHGYDVPQELNFSNRDAATVNLLFAADPNVTRRSINRPYRNELYDEYRMNADFSNILTSVVTRPRIGLNSSLIPPAMDAANAAFQQYRAGNPAALGKAIGVGLRNLNRDFCHLSTLDRDAKAPGILGRRILSLLEAHPDLIPHTGLDQEELELAYGNVALATVIENSAQAADALARDAKGLTYLTPQEKAKCLGDMALREALSSAIHRELNAWSNNPDNPQKQAAIQKRINEHRQIYYKTLEDLQNHPKPGQEDLQLNIQQNMAADMVGDPLIWGDLYNSRRDPSAYVRALGRPGALQGIQEQYRNDPGILRAVRRNVKELHADPNLLKQHTKTALEPLLNRIPKLSHPSTPLTQTMLGQRCQERGGNALDNFILSSLDAATKAALPRADLRLTGSGKYALEAQEAARQLQSRPLVAQDLATGKMKTLLFREGQVQTLDTDAYMAQMQAQLKDADRRVFFGSRQFKDLSAKLDALAAYKAGDPPTATERADMATLARELSTSARNYLTHKNALDPNSPSQGPKTDQRIRLARELMEFGTTLYNAHLEQRTYEEANSVRPVREETPLDTAIRRNYRVAGLPGHTLPDLKDEILRDLQGVDGLLIGSGPMDPQRQAQAKVTMAKMIAFQGIRNERLHPASDGGQLSYNSYAGPLEQLYSKDPEKFLNAIKESDQFYRITQNMGRGNLEDFLLKSPKDQQIFVQNTLQAATTSLNKQPMAPIAGM